LEIIKRWSVIYKGFGTEGLAGKNYQEIEMRKFWIFSHKSVADNEQKLKTPLSSRQLEPIQ
jgi:hypothetical protein